MRAQDDGFVRAQAEELIQNHGKKLVGVTGFEPATSWSQTTRATNCATPRCEKQEKKKRVGWLMGIEPTYVGITIRCVNHFATATTRDTKIEA